ncbi:hypothetical protein [Kitasatospora viridis]|uniref:Uncharacterized protein n=1 Tax=Kitasatospora viridis TaxID=281105 RepID=A0A561UQE0_9ACTN|nr:hypothetical protein [Kitasatospora viridis]TWG01549.1 hypothetical protein FHX73_115450 [Kitasatospora viridis]
MSRGAKAAGAVVVVAVLVGGYFTVQALTAPDNHPLTLPRSIEGDALRYSNTDASPLPGLDDMAGALGLQNGTTGLYGNAPQNTIWPQREMWRLMIGQPVASFDDQNSKEAASGDLKLMPSSLPGTLYCNPPDISSWPAICVWSDLQHGIILSRATGAGAKAPNAADIQQMAAAVAKIHDGTEH